MVVRVVEVSMNTRISRARILRVGATKILAQQHDMM